MAQTQQIRMSLMFDANTSKAKASLKDLQNSLNGFTKSIANEDFPMTEKIQEAYVAAEKLKTVLNSSVNMNTGQFDLTKFNAQLKQSGLSAAELGQKFAGAGAAGAQTFAQLATAIANAEMPTKRMTAMAENLARSLKQTLQWQISSSAIHALTGALSSAYGYAKDLNRSLTDIRIVTGEGAEFMSDFAREANKAAKELSATTNEYAKASLIFYQQGLSGAEVQKRTDAVIKMANVTGESASDISSYMTAIWNNFDDGTKSLEYYADAMTALGAATASSTEEIATGMQQFASVAETVGLSYEYAASALATVVSATRQSEETVGTSFKTIFSRLSSLSLGETLDDGTNLTKYSQALAKVGVDIKNQQGELKDMDQILDELGAKWSAISKEQQTALAYTVAGSRQYNNFISLLDNYEDFKINVELAVESDGTLNKQQKIYAEGWEAAANRARAAAEGVYDKLINDEFFIDLLEGLEKFLNGFDKFIDAVGGLPGILSIVSSLMFKAFGSQIAESVRNFTYNLRDSVSFLGLAQKQAAKTKQEFMDMATQLIEDTQSDVISNDAAYLELDLLKQKINLEQTYIQFEDQLSQKQKDEYKLQLSLLEVLRQQTIEKQKRIDATNDKFTDFRIGAFKSAKQVAKEDFKPNVDKAVAAVEANKELDKVTHSIEQMDAQIADTELELGLAREQLSGQLQPYQTSNKGHGYMGVTQQEKGGLFTITDEKALKNSADIPDDAKKSILETQALVKRLEERLKAQNSVGIGLIDRQDQAREAVATAQEAADPKNWVQPKNSVDASIELQRYFNYTSGEANKGHDQLNSLISQYGAVSQEGAQPGQESYDKLFEALDLFIAKFSEELGQEAIDIASKMQTGLMEGSAERPSMESLQAEADAAKEASFEHYDKSAKDPEDKRKDWERVRESMRDDVGVEFEDESVWVEFNDILETQKQNYKELTKSTQKYDKANDKTTKNLKKKGAKNVKDFADTFTELSSGISNAATVFNAFSGLLDIWADKDMTFGEKLTSSFMSLVTIIPSAIAAFNSFNSVLGISTAISNLYHAAQLKKLAASGAITASMTAEQLVEKTGMTLEQAEIVLSKMSAGATWAEAAAEAGLTGAKGAGTSATIAQTIANFALQASMFPILVITVAIIAAVVILVASIALLANAFKAFKNSRPDAVLAGAEEQAERLGEALASAKEQADNLRASIEKYDTAVDKLKGLVQGTDAYRLAVQEANEAARELIDNYEGVEYTFNANTGLIEIDEESLAAAQERAANSVSAAERDYLTAQNAVHEAEVANTAYQKSKEHRKDTKATLGTLGLLSLLTSAALPVMMGVMVASAVQENNQEKGLNNLFKAYSENGQDFGAAMGSLTKAQQRAIDKLDMTDTELEALCAEMRQNTIAVIENNKQIAASLMADDEDYENSEAKNTASALAGKYITERANQLYEEQYKDGQGMTDKEAQQAYAEAMGWDPNLVKNKGGNTAIYYDKDGQEVTLGDETVRRYLADKAAQEEAKIQASDYVEQAESIVGTIKRYGQGNLTTEQADMIGADIVTGKTADLSMLTPKQIAEIAKSTKNATDQHGQALYKAAEEANKVWVQSTKQLGITARKEMFDIAATNETLSQEQLIKYGQSIDAVATSFGANTASQYADTINQLMADNEDKAQEIANIAAGIDWTNGEQGLRDLQGQLSEIDVTINEDDASWQAFAESMRNAQVSVLKWDLETIRTQLVEIGDLVEGLDLGSIITDEDYATLLKYNGELAKYFQMTAEGYRYNGEGDLSAEMVNSMAESSLEDMLEGNRLAREGAKTPVQLDYYKDLDDSYLGGRIASIGSDTTGSWDATLKALGQDKEELLRLSTQLNSTDPDIKKAAEEKAKKFYGKVEQLQARVKAGEYDDSNAYEVYASRKYQTARELYNDRQKFAEAGQMEAYNKQMTYLVNQGASLLEEYNDAMTEFRLEGLQEEFDSLMELEGGATEAIEALKEQSDIYKDTLDGIEEQVVSLGEQYGVTREDGESLTDFMSRIVQEALVAGEEILELTEQMKEAGESLRELDTQMAEALMKHFEDIQAGWDKTMEEYERGAESIAHMKEIMSLTGLDVGNPDMTRQLSDLEREYAKASLGASRQNYEELRMSRQQAEASLQNALNSDDKEAAAQWQETLDNIIEMENDALETMNDNWTSALETAADTLEANTEAIMNSFEQSMSGIYGSFDRMSEVFDQQSELNTQYIADYKKVYELSKLTRNIENQIDNTDNVAAKQSLRELQGEINALQANGVEMSEYDLEYLQKKYDLRLAEIALEDAQNAKNQVRLSKMADGSWGYVYTANTNAIETAQQNYEDKLYELQELSSSYLDETSSAIIQTQADFQSAIQEIMSSGLSDEEKRAQIEQTVAFYQEKLSFLTSEFDQVIANNQNMAGMVQNFSDSLLGAMYPDEDFSTAENIFEKWSSELGTWEGDGILGQLNTELTNYEQAVEDIFEVAGAGSIGEYVDSIDKALNGEDGEGGLANALQQSIEDMLNYEPENTELTILDDMLTQIDTFRIALAEECERIKASYAEILALQLPEDDIPVVVEEESDSEDSSTRHQYRGNIAGGRGMVGLAALHAQAFDTGGYTGAWGPEGRLAMLHEKELVLNADDTSNLLRTMEVVDQLIKNIELQALSSAVGALKTPQVRTNGDTLQQEVTIHAEFPNATNHSEIEQAFDTLINRAAQYANRNR